MSYFFDEFFDEFFDLVLVQPFFDDIKNLVDIFDFLCRKLDRLRSLDTSMLPDGIGADTVSVTATENLSANSLVNITATGARKADASNARRAHGYVKSAVTSGQTATIYKEGTITAAALTAGEPCYLGTNGAITQTAASASGYISQEIGVALSATEVEFEPQSPITLA